MHIHLTPLHSITNIYAKETKCYQNITVLEVAITSIPESFKKSPYAEDLKKQLKDQKHMLKGIKKAIAVHEQMSFPFGATLSR